MSAKLKAAGQLFLSLVKSSLVMCGIFALVILTLSAFLVPVTPTDSGEIDPPEIADSAEKMYLELLKRTLTRYQFGERYRPLSESAEKVGMVQQGLVGGVNHLLRLYDLELVRTRQFNAEVRASGQDWPAEAETMIGLKRLNNLQDCAEQALQSSVPGDFIECGVWRGGSCIFMRAILKAYNDRERKVWAADSFEGLPPVSETAHQVDRGLWRGGEMAVSIEEVRSNFRRYGLLDDQVAFLKGFFADSLPEAPIERLALLRLDADLYESTTQALTYLYPKLSPGGCLIVDDFNLQPAKDAVHDYRKAQGIEEEIITIDANGVFWVKKHGVFWVKKH